MCMCGWQTRGTEDEVVMAIQDHGEEAHGRRPSRDEILALAVGERLADWVMFLDAYEPEPFRAFGQPD